MSHTLNPSNITSFNNGEAFYVILGGPRRTVPSILVDRQNGSFEVLERARGRNMQQINRVRYEGYDPAKGTVEKRVVVRTLKEEDPGYEPLDSSFKEAGL